MTTNLSCVRVTLALRDLFNSCAKAGEKQTILGKFHWFKSLGLLFCLVSAATADTFGLFTYTDDGTSITITAYSRNAVGACEIPSEIGGKPVTIIGESAFSYCSSVTSVTIPDSVTTIGSSAFMASGSLTSIAIQNSITSIGDYAFSSCSSLTSVAIPNSVTTIGIQAFTLCTSLTSVIIGTGITCIANQMFQSCTSLTDVSMPSSISTIGTNAFYGCAKLASVTIPSNVTSIGNGAFNFCTSLTNIIVPNSVATICDGAFYGCTKLNSVTLPPNLTSIGMQAFSSCTGLTSVAVPGSVSSIGDDTFSHCTSLTSITIGSVSAIGVRAFYGCSSLAEIVFSDSLLSIGDYAFKECASLTSVGIPDSVTSIGIGAFMSCASLAEITLGVGSATYSSVDGVLFDKNKTTLIRFPGGKGGSYTIPSSVARLGDSAFALCGKLTSVIIPDNVTSIGVNVFSSCTSLASVTIGNGITSIVGQMFSGCTKLTSVTISTSISSIGSNAFSACSSLSSVTIPPSVTSIGGGAFLGCTKLASAVFMGNAPSMGADVFKTTASGFKVTYLNGRTGFTSPTWNGYTAVSITLAPVVATGVAVEIAAASVIMQGTVNPNGAANTARFEYGPTTAYGSTASVTLSPNNGFGSQSVSANVNGLQPGQTYHYRLTATNSGGTSTGSDMTFSTNSVLTINALHGTVPGAGQYAPGTMVGLAATPTPGYVFAGWSGDASGTANPLSALMDANKTIIATFVPDTSDTDGDGLNNFEEAVTYGTNPTLRDTDGDGITDAWEVGVGRFSIVAGAFTWAQARADAHARGGELACFPTAARWARAMESLGTGATDNFVGLWIGASDAAAEGVWTWINGEQFAFTNWATSRPSGATGNTLDYAEVSGGGGAEIEKWYDRTATFVRDGYILEVGYSINPILSDSDGDCLADGQEENNYHTNPMKADSDGDGFSDGAEVEFGGNPLLGTVVPDLKGRALLDQQAGTVQFRFPSKPGEHYTLEGSTNLVEWIPLEMVIVGTGGTISRSYPLAAAPRRWFRAKQQ